MRRSRIVTKLALGLIAALAASSSLAATIINTVPSWNGNSSICCFGAPNTQTYGQTVTVPAGETSLTSFSFWINDGGANITLLGEVYAWDTVNSHTTGAGLFESGSVTTGGTNSFQQISFTIPGGVPVTAGQVYVLFATTSKSAQTPASARWGALTNDTTYVGGQFVFQNNGVNFGNLSTVSWSGIPEDLAFTAGFGGATVASIPTLSGSMLLMLGAALALVGVIVLRLRQS